MTYIRQFTLAALIATAPAYAGDDDLLKMVSEDTDLAIHVTNTKKTKANWDKSPLKKVYENDEIKPRVEKALEEAFSFDGIEDKAIAEALKKNICALYDQVEGEILFSVKMPDLTTELLEKFMSVGGEGEDAAARLAFGTFGGLLLAEVKDAEAFGAASKELFEMAKKKIDEQEEAKGSLDSKKVGDVEVTSLSAEFEGKSIKMLSYALVGNTAVMFMGAYEVEDVLDDIQKGADKPLSKSSYLVDGVSDFQMLGDFSDMMNGMKNALNVAVSGESSMEQLQINVDAGWKALGMNGIDRLGVAVDMSKPDIVMTSKMDVPTAGVLSVLIPSDPISKPSIHAHDGVLAVGQSSYDLANFYDELMKTIGAISPMGPMVVGMQISKFEQQIGIKLRDDLLASLAPKFEYVQYRADTPEEAAKSYGVIIGLKDKDKFEASIKTMVGAMGMEVEKDEFLDETIYSIALPMVPGEKLSYAFNGGDVIMGLDTTGTVKEAIKQIKNPKDRLWDSDIFADHKYLLKPGASALTLSDFEATMTTVFETFTALAGEDEDSIDFSKIKIPYGYTAAASWVKDGVATSKSVIFAK